MDPKRLSLGRDGWYLCQPEDRPEFEFRELKGNDAVALGMLRQFKHDTAVMTKLREWAGSGSGASAADEEVLRRIAWQIVTGRLKALQRKTESGGGGAGQGTPEPAGPAFPLEERRTATGGTSSSAAPDPPTLPQDADLLAIAENLKVAARKGIPICVECQHKAPAEGIQT